MANVEEDDDVCVVCMESLESDHVHSMDACGHRFHSKCIIGWMQRGHLSCPTCRGDLRDGSETIPSMALYERARYVRRTLGRRANIPGDLKRILERLRRAETDEREQRRTVRTFERSHRDFFKEYNTLRRKRYRNMRRCNNARRLLGLYQTPGYTLPSLRVVNDFNSF